MKAYLTDAQALCSELKTSADGITSADAAARLEKNGKNKLKEGKKESVFKKFMKQLADPMIIILIVAAVVSGIIAAINHEVPTDVFIIMFVVILNAILGVAQESKAESAIAQLQEMTAATSKVMRDGKQITVKSEDLVSGDVIVLEAGDSVPADARLIEANSLKCEEAALTGESVPSDKNTEVLRAASDGEVPLGDRSNMVYMGSTVAYGRGKAVICDTGMDTEMGKIAGALSEMKDEKTPLQIKLSQLSKVLTYLVLIICVVIFGSAVLRAGNFSLEQTILPSFMIAVSLAVAAIPEGLAAVVTIVLSIGVTRMSKRSAVIRRLSAVETLGCTQIICSDKTGTLTQNKMTVTDDFTSDREVLCRAMALCNDAELDENNSAVGEPTECALVNYAFKNGWSKNDLKNSQPRVSEVPFDSMRKMMTTVHDENGNLFQYTKGAPDELLKCCTQFLGQNGSITELTDEKRAEILAKNKSFADQALRVLAAAYRPLDSLEENTTADAYEHDLIFIGLCGMIDPIRPEVKDAIAECRAAGIRPIMITGDHKDTAVAIAMQLGIITDASQAITGAELNAVSDEQLDTAIEKYSVYARVQPEHKVRIVKAWKKKGMITAMTGDGVNDAPSIKAADIGIGMGITGTDVTKNVADLVLADDNFATIVNAVEEGRKIYSNIKKAIQFLLSSNMSEVLTIFIATMIGFTILKAPHLLWINLITDCFPALALGMEAGEKNIMNQKPRPSGESIFANGMGFDIAYQGILVTIVTLAAYYIGIGPLYDAGCGSASMQGMTMAFLTMSMAEIFHSYNMRSQRGSIFTLGTHNKYLLGAMVISLILTAVVIEIPAVAAMFGFATIDIVEYATALGLAIIMIPAVELVKLIQRKAAKKKAE
jgi:Ca2+-transporting ATPase